MTDSDNPIVAKASLERRFVATAAALEQHGSTLLIRRRRRRCAHPDDIEALVWALKKLREISQTEPLASQLEMVTPESIFDSDATLERYM